MRCEHHISPEWRKSSYSGHGDEQGGSSCLEVNDTTPTTHIHIRDSKRRQRPGGPVLTVPSSSWTAFLRTLR
ncbi:DUF397 domain-containing protein [Streptomyces triculaminicus]|uniref:DUF397 domain-containing protein n=1 Tax=Streptomyces triculaminicus TaxID=2816232 RepID=UPI0037D74043